MANIITKDFAAKSQAEAIKLASNFGNGAATFGNGNFNVWMLAVSAAPLWNGDDIGTVLYTAYAKAQNANPRCTRPINLDSGNTLANKAAQVNAFANASRELGGPAKVYAYCDELIAALKSVQEDVGYDVDNVRKYIAASVKAKAFVPVAEIKSEMVAKAAKAAKEAKARERAKKRGPNFADAVSALRANLKAMVDAFEGGQSMVFQHVLKTLEREVEERARAPRENAKGNGKGAIKGKTQVAPRVDASIN